MNTPGLISMTELARICKCRRYNIKSYVDMGLIVPESRQVVVEKPELIVGKDGLPTVVMVDKITTRYGFTYSDVDTVKSILKVGKKRMRRAK